MSYEKEKKTQTDHAELMKRLATKLSEVITTLNNKS